MQDPKVRIRYDSHWPLKNLTLPLSHPLVDELNRITPVTPFQSSVKMPACRQGSRHPLLPTRPPPVLTYLGRGGD